MGQLPGPPLGLPSHSCLSVPPLSLCLLELSLADEKQDKVAMLNTSLIIPQPGLQQMFGFMHFQLQSPFPVFNLETQIASHAVCFTSCQKTKLQKHNDRFHRLLFVRHSWGPILFCKVEWVLLEQGAMSGEREETIEEKTG